MAINDYRALYLYGEPDLTLSGGSWLGGSLPNLLEPRLERIARSASLSTASTRFDVTLKRPTDISALCLVSTNLTPDADIEVTFWPDSSFSGLPIATLNPTVPDDPDPDRRPSVFAIPADLLTGMQFVSVDIDDHLNPIGYVDLGYLHLGAYLKAPINYQYGAGMSFISNAIVAQTMSGGEAVWDRGEPRSLPLAFDFTDESDIFGDVYAFQRTVKRGGNVIIIPDPSADPTTMQRRSFMGHAVQRNAMTQTYFRLGAWGAEIREVMGLKPEVIAAIFRLTLDGGSFVFTFPDTSLTALQAAGLTGGSFILTGKPLAFVYSRLLRAAVGTFALTGSALAFRQGHVVALGLGSFGLTGSALGLKRQVLLPLANGSFALTGSTLGLIVRRLAMDGGAFALTGEPLAFKRGLRLPLGAGSFALTGGAVEMSSGTRLLMLGGSFVLSGQDVGLYRSSLMGLGAGSFAISGGAVGHSVAMPLDTGSFAVSGNLALKANKIAQLSAGTFALTGEDIEATHQARITLGAGSFAAGGQDVDLRNYHLRVLAGDQAGNTRVLAGDQAGNRRRTTN